MGELILINGGGGRVYYHHPWKYHLNNLLWMFVISFILYWGPWAGVLYIGGNFTPILTTKATAISALICAIWITYTERYN